MVRTAGRVGARRLAQLQEALSDRDRAILSTLGALRYATTRQIERLHTRPQSASAQGATRAAQRTLTRLHRLGLCGRLTRRIGGVRAGSAGHVWHLTPTGTRLLASPSPRRTNEPGLTHLAHVLDAAELVVSLHEHARTHAIGLEVQTEPGCWRRLPHERGRARWLKPDLRVTVELPDFELHWFVEIDRGTESRSVLTRKINTYLTAWHHGHETKQAGVFPRVLWATPGDKRADEIAAVCATTLGVPHGMFTTTPLATAVAVLASGP